MTTERKFTVAEHWELRLDCFRLALSMRAENVEFQANRIYEFAIAQDVRLFGPTSASPADRPKAGNVNGPGNPGQASDMAPRKRL